MRSGGISNFKPIYVSSFHPLVIIKHMQDTYKAITKESQGLYKDKGSKFIALAFPVMDEDQIREILEGVKKEYYDARHHCYAWVLGYNQDHHKFNDDGEPSGTAGKPIWGQLRSYEICHALIIVVRYFGGTKLGVRGLIDAYKGAARDAIENNKIVTKTIRDYYNIDFDYPSMNDVMRIMKEFDLLQHNHDFGIHCRIEFSIRQKDAGKVLNQFKLLRKTNLTFLRTH